MLRRLLKTSLVAVTLLQVNTYAKMQTPHKEFVKPPYDVRLDKYAKTKQWYSVAGEDSDAAYNLGYIYQTEIKDNKLAELWYKKALRLDASNSTAMNNLAYLYQNQKKYGEAEKWFKKAVATGYFDAIANLGTLYHQELKDDVKASQYYIAMIGKPYSKDQVVDFLKNQLNISEADIKKGYELQLESKVIAEKLKYKGGI